MQNLHPVSPEFVYSSVDQRIVPVATSPASGGPLSELSRWGPRWYVRWLISNRSYFEVTNASKRIATGCMRVIVQRSSRP